MPSAFGFEPHNPRYGPFLVLGSVDTNCAQSMPFLVLFWPFLGNIVESQRNKEPLATARSRRTYSGPTISLRLAILNGFEGRFVPKKGVSGQKVRTFGTSPPNLVPPP